MPRGDLTKGKIFPTLNRFAIPLLLALLLQSLYGCVDMLMVGKFSIPSEMSGVATGGLIMLTVTDFFAALAVGVTTLLGNNKGAGRTSVLGKCIGGGTALFLVLAIFLTSALVVFARPLSIALQAPEDAIGSTTDYLFICGVGILFVAAYNLLSAVMRGLGDSKTPLFTVFVAFATNVVLDYLFVAVWHKGAAGAAWATVISQALSVALSLLIVVIRGVDFPFSWRDIRLNKLYSWAILKLGLPIALQDFIVSLSYLTIQIVGNSIDVTTSAAVGIGEKMSYFLMLVPISYMQTIAAFVAQNEGARLYKRSTKALFLGMIPSSFFGILTGCALFFFADFFSGLFTNDAAIIKACHAYLMIYGLDCILTPALFCFCGYYSGCGKSVFVMEQGIIGAFCMRMPTAIIARYVFHTTSLFYIALGSPIASLLQIALCIFFMRYGMKKAQTVQNHE